MPGLILYLSLLALFSRTAGAEVWAAVQVWDATWETEYSGWIAREVDAGFLKPTGLRPDCADLVYTLRAVFSRENQLPFLASEAAGRRTGHFSGNWDNHTTRPEWRQDPRFVAFLRDLFGWVSTRTLHYDTYPVALNPVNIRPGLIVYEDRIASHAAVLGRIGDKTLLPATYYEAFRPGQDFITISSMITVRLYGPEIPRRHSGIVRWRWPRRCMSRAKRSRSMMSCCRTSTRLTSRSKARRVRKALSGATSRLRTGALSGPRNSTPTCDRPSTTRMR